MEKDNAYNEVAHIADGLMLAAGGDRKKAFNNALMQFANREELPSSFCYTPAVMVVILANIANTGNHSEPHEFSNPTRDNYSHERWNTINKTIYEFFDAMHSIYEKDAEV